MKTKFLHHPLLAFVGLTGAFLLAASLTAPAQNPSAPVRVYPPAPGEPLSTQFVVKAEDQTVPVYLATVIAMNAQRRERTDLQHFEDGDLGQTSFASFDLRGDAHVTVTCPGPINSIKLLPTSCGIVPQVTGNNVTFTLSKPGQFVLEVNGNTVQCLQIFANPWDADAPNPNDPNVIYYGPGLHKVHNVKVGSGKTVYIAGDAVVYGTPSGPIFILHGDNITLRGRGIIDGSICPHPVSPLIASTGNNISLEGVVLRDSGAWTMPLTACNHVTVKNIKIFGYRGNSDGIDVNDTQNVDISDCYIRTNDDLIVVKTQILGRGESRHITAEHCVLWNELAHALSIGAEIRQPVSDVVFSDCDIIHDMGREWLLRVYHTDSATVSNVTFRDIRIEECRRLISLWIGGAIWSKDKERGHIDNITFQNINSPAPSRQSSPVELVGFDADHAIHDVKFDHVVVGGQPLKASDVKQNPFAYGITLTP
ncbi:MAG: glycosyl hydrolase family 28 protein [Methylacidiphilales bacterium]|nr:glycosyl hydrolase family 28 protein [Candidatus Methylacidiphilales bacterium]